MRRRTVIGLSAAVIGSLLAGTVAAIAGAGHGLGRETMVRRMAAAAIDGALDEAQASAEQRAAIHAARDRVFAAIQDHRRERGARLDGMLALFEGDRLDDGLPELRRQIEAEHEKIADSVTETQTTLLERRRRRFTAG